MSASTKRFSPGAYLPWLSAAALPLTFLDGGGALGVAAVLLADGALGAGALLEARSLGQRIPTVRRVLPGRLV
ncbi:MAG: hypothetical protein H5U40_06810, partial [Polyangiaceae bacterium]|nr:hypothetical protein [Polyangiaceae bacterium]